MRVCAGVGGFFWPPRVVGRPTAQTRFDVVASPPLDRQGFESYLDAFLNEAQVDTPDRQALTENPLAIAGFSARSAREPVPRSIRKRCVPPAGPLVTSRWPASAQKRGRSIAAIGSVAMTSRRWMVSSSSTINRFGELAGFKGISNGWDDSLMGEQGEASSNVMGLVIICDQSARTCLRQVSKVSAV